MSAFRSSLPIAGTAFVNKVGAIGLSLLPILLVERQVSPGQASLVLGFGKAAILLGNVLGGVACDRIGLRRVLLSSFLISGVALAGLAFAPSLLLLAFCVIMANAGNSFFNAAARPMLMRLVRPTQRREAVAWLRMGNNLGQIVSFSLASLLAFVGLMPLILFDAFTSLMAFLVGYRWIPREPRQPKAVGEAPEQVMEKAGAVTSWRPFVAITSLIALTNFVYELFMLGSSGRYRVLFGPEGIRVYSVSMVLNTVLCAVFAVPASRWLRPGTALGWGIGLTAAGGTIALASGTRLWGIALGMLVLTVGEIFFGSAAQHLQIELLPAGKSEGAVFGLSLTCQASGRILAAVLAFPLIVAGQSPVLVYGLLVSLAVGLAVPLCRIALVGRERSLEVVPGVLS